MNKVEIIRTFDKADVLPFEHFLIGNVEIDNKTKEEIVRLIAMGVLKSSVDNSTLAVNLRIGKEKLAKTIVHVHELSEELQLNNLRLRILSNEDDLPCKPGKRYGDERWFERNKKELYLAEREDGKLAVLDYDGNMHFGDWFDNVCLVTWQSHPCYPEDTEFGIVVMKNHEFACVKEKGAEHAILLPMSRNINEVLMYSELTPFDARQYKFEYEKHDYDGSYWKQIYQSFWGYERSWAYTEKQIEVQYDENISYYENIMANGNPYRMGGRHDDMPYEEFLKTYIPYYIMFRGIRKFYAHSKEELEEFLAKYDADKKCENLKEYESHYAI